MPTPEQVVRRFLTAFKYQPKESKQHKVQRLMQVVRETTGVSRSTAEDIADAVVRNRDLGSLAVQKGWPIEDGVLVGPKGQMTVVEIKKLEG